MKALAVIFTIALVASGILFGLMIAANGIDSELNETWSSSSGETQNYDNVFTEGYDNIDISVISASVKIRLSDDDTTSVSYKGVNKNIEFEAGINNDELIIREKQISVWSFFGWNFGFQKSELNVTIPKGLYDEIMYNTVSGDADIILPDSDKLGVNTVSGSIKLKGYADVLEVSTVSGKVDIINTTDKTSEKLTVNATSGKTTVTGYMPERFDVSSISGGVILDGITGKGELNMTSGSSELIYSKWNDDLSVSLISGKANITLPMNSGVKLQISAVSGKVKYDLDGESGVADKKTKSVTFGGDNVNKIDVDLTSGTVNITNGEYSKTKTVSTYVVVEDTEE